MRSKLLFLSLFCSFAALPSAIAEEPLAIEAEHHFEPFSGKVAGSKVRLRTQPSLEGYVVRESDIGEMFAVTDERDGFYNIIPPSGTKGYIFRTFVLENTVEGDHVNVRLFPDIEAPVIGQLNTGDQVEAKISDVNNKWLVIDAPASAHFFIAKEYIENCGPVELMAQREERHREATHRLGAAFLYAQSEIQKPFALVDLSSVHEKLIAVGEEFSDLPDIVRRTAEANEVMRDIYVQKKLAFIEDQYAPKTEIDSSHLDKLADLGLHFEQSSPALVVEWVEETSSAIGMASPVNTEEMTDKMLLWNPLEESLYHYWAVSHGEQGTEAFYNEEAQNAKFLSGIVEPYNRSVKNKPGDFVLKADSFPVAFLYSTRINLQSLIGKEVTLIAVPRPNNNFAFPAYYVLNVQ